MKCNSTSIELQGRRELHVVLCGNESSRNWCRMSVSTPIAAPIEGDSLVSPGQAISLFSFVHKLNAKRAVQELTASDINARQSLEQRQASVRRAGADGGLAGHPH